MPKGCYSLLRQRRRFLQRNEDWFCINRFKFLHQDLLTSPTFKYLEKLELEHEQESGEPREGNT